MPSRKAHRSDSIHHGLSKSTSYSVGSPERSGMCMCVGTHTICNKMWENVLLIWHNWWKSKKHTSYLLIRPALRFFSKSLWTQDPVQVMAVQMVYSLIIILPFCWIILFLHSPVERASLSSPWTSGKEPLLYTVIEYVATYTTIATYLVYANKCLYECMNALCVSEGPHKTNLGAWDIIKQNRIELPDSVCLCLAAGQISSSDGTAV